MSLRTLKYLAKTPTICDDGKICTPNNLVSSNCCNDGLGLCSPVGDVLGLPPTTLSYPFTDESPYPFVVGSGFLTLHVVVETIAYPGVMFGEVVGYLDYDTSVSVDPSLLVRNLVGFVSPSG